MISGEIDIDTEQVLQHALRQALVRSVRGVDLDLSRVGFCDCAGLNVLLRVRRLALADAKTLTIRVTGPAVQKLLALTGTSSLFAPARAPLDRTVHRWHPPATTTHDRGEEDGVPDEAAELRTEVVQLRRAMQTRPVIDLARGVLMASFGLSPDAAWAVLVDVSQHTNTKLHRLAEDLVATVDGTPLAEPVRQRLSAAVAEISQSR